MPAGAWQLKANAVTVLQVLSLGEAERSSSLAGNPRSLTRQDVRDVRSGKPDDSNQVQSITLERLTSLYFRYCTAQLCIARQALLTGLAAVPPIPNPCLQ
jgi:hypothetical protein